jgi:hypothetical protein
MKNDPQRTYKLPINYYHVENESVCKTPIRKVENVLQNSIKIHNPSEANECRCSNHAKADGFMRDKNDASSKDPSERSNVVFRHFGAPSREEIEKEDVEETFDF